MNPSREPIEVVCDSCRILGPFPLGFADPFVGFTVAISRADGSFEAEAFLVAEGDGGVGVSSARYSYAPTLAVIEALSLDRIQEEMLQVIEGLVRQRLLAANEERRLAGTPPRTIRLHEATSETLKLWALGAGFRKALESIGCRMTRSPSLETAIRRALEAVDGGDGTGLRDSGSDRPER